jgi:hypothetical protein
MKQNICEHLGLYFLFQQNDNEICSLQTQIETQVDGVHRKRREKGSNERTFSCAMRLAYKRKKQFSLLRLIDSQAATTSNSSSLTSLPTHHTSLINF